MLYLVTFLDRNELFNILLDKKKFRSKVDFKSIFSFIRLGLNVILYKFNISFTNRICQGYYWIQF